MKPTDASVQQSAGQTDTHTHINVHTRMHTHVWKDRGDKGVAGVTGGALKRPEGLVCGRGRRGASLRQVAC